MFIDGHLPRGRGPVVLLGDLAGFPRTTVQPTGFVDQTPLMTSPLNPM
ncbi:MULTISPECIES: hypothetical protein [unclassified Streptosporangium]